MASTVRKVSVALGREELAWAQKKAEREGTSVSAVLTEVARRARAEELRRARQRRAWSVFEKWATDGMGLGADDLERGRHELGGE